MKRFFTLIFICTFFTDHILAQWTELGTGINSLNANSNILSIAADNAGNIYAGGYFSNGSFYTEGKRYVAKWNGSSWEQLVAETYTGGSAQYITNVITDSAGNLYAAAQLQYGSYVIKWDGSSWSELGSGVKGLYANGTIWSIATDNAGNIYAAGYFSAGAQADQGTKYIAKWNGLTWSDLGSSATKLNAHATITKVITDTSGNVYTIVDTTHGRGVFQKIYKFNGSDWVELSAGINGTHNFYWWINNIAVDKAGNIYATVLFEDGPDLGQYGYIAKWNGTTWSDLGAPGENNFFDGYSLTVDKYGKVYAVGLSKTDNNEGNGFYYDVAVYNGSSWTRLCAANDCLNANDIIANVISDAEGNIYAAGNFTDSNGKKYVARYSSLAGPVPLRLLSFNASLQNNNDAKLQWQIASPEDGSKYELLRSLDGQIFQVITTQTGYFTSFSYTDRSLHNGIYYYRLQMTDKDGKITYSNIAIIKVGSKEQLISAYPNPIKRGENLQLSLQNVTAHKIELINSIGQVVYTNSSKLTGSISIPVSPLCSPGQYLLRVISEEKTLTQKILIK